MAKSENPKPLVGKRIMITRVRSQALELADNLRRLGARSLLYPTIDVRSFHDPDEWRKLDEITAINRWLFFTSENGVRFFYKQLSQTREYKAVISGMKTAAIGKATAKTVRKSGIDPDFVADMSTAEKMAEEFLEKHSVSDMHIVRVRGNLADSTIEDRFGRAGAKVHRLTVYETFNPLWEKKRKDDLLRRPPDGVIFTSGSTVTGFRKNLSDPECKLIVDRAAIFSIGPSTTGAIAAQGWKINGEADPHSTEGIVKAVVAYFSTKAQA
jgi:uroporphyrinogen III methyltransferase/synthase